MDKYIGTRWDLPMFAVLTQDFIFLAIRMTRRIKGDTQAPLSVFCSRLLTIKPFNDSSTNVRLVIIDITEYVGGRTLAHKCMGKSMNRSARNIPGIACLFCRPRPLWWRWLRRGRRGRLLLWRVGHGVSIVLIAMAKDCKRILMRFDGMRTQRERAIGANLNFGITPYCRGTNRPGQGKLSGKANYSQQKLLVSTYMFMRYGYLQIASICFPRKTMYS